MEDFIQEIEFIGNIGDGSGPPPIAPLEPSLFSVGKTFFTALLTSVAMLSLALYTDADAFHAPTVMNEAQAMLANETDGLAISFIDNSMKIKDTVTPANNYDAAPFSKLTFSRASLAMHYDSAGVLKYAPHNLVLQSQTFDNASWVKAGSTVSANSIVAPDGTTTAETLIEASGFVEHRAYQPLTTSAVLHTWTIYAKAKERSWIALRGAAGGLLAANFNVATGVVGTKSAGATSSIQSVGNGWYRCTMTGIGTAGANAEYMVLNLGDTDTGTTMGYTYTGDSVSGLYIWGAQIELGSVANPYNPTTTAAYHGPRIDYDPATLEKRGFLIEEVRTNLALRSQEFDNASWSNLGLASVTANSIVAPDGTTTADMLTENTSTSRHIVYQGMPVTTSVLYAYSVYGKKGTRDRIILKADKTANNAGAIFNLNLGTVGASQNCTATIVPINNGWYRCTIVYTPDSTTTTNHHIGLANNDTLDINSESSYLGNSSTAYIWGAQFELGAFATSYIPTTTAAATRAVDVTSLATSLFPYSATVGSVYSLAASFSASSVRAIWLFRQDVSNRFYGSASGGRMLYYYTAAVAVADLSPGIYADNVFSKAAIAFASNDFAAVLRGGTPSTDTSGGLITATALRLGTTDTIENLNGWIKQLRYVPRRMSNAELQALTT